MMTEEITYQMVSQEDKERVKALWQYCFDDEERFVSWYFQHYYQQENTLGAYINGALVGATQMIPYTISLHGQGVPVGYIVGVGTAPEARRGGIGRGMLIASLTMMREKRQKLALLMPFEGSFYYPYQWRFCYFHHKYTLAITELSNLRDTYGKIVAVDPLAEIQVLNGIYQGFTKGKNGYVLRTRENWINLIADLQFEKSYCYVVYNQDVAEGYLLYYFKGDTMVIREMAYLRHQARGGLMDFIYGHRSHKATVEWSGPIDDGAEFLLAKSKTGTVLYPFLMARVVDVSQLLAQLTFKVDLPNLKIQVEDHLLWWNNGIFDFSVTDGQGQAQLLDDLEGEEGWDLHLGVDSLTQLIMGAVDCQTLRNQQLLKVASEEAFLEWEALWPRELNFINECY